MKKKQLKKLFKEDFEKAYKVNYNEEEVLKHFIAKEKEPKKIIKRKKVKQKAEH